MIGTEALNHKPDAINILGCHGFLAHNLNVDRWTFQEH